VKRGRVCDEFEPLVDFYKAAGARDGYRSECKACNLARRASVYRDNPRPAIERATKWQRENPERHRERQREYAESGKKKVSDRKSHSKRKYGLTLEQFDEMLASQGRGCAICGNPDADNVDHDHETGRVRGILCWDCNIALGKFADDEDRALAAGGYLSGNTELAKVARDRLVALSS
jgi:hypothetical protein